MHITEILEWVKFGMACLGLLSVIGLVVVQFTDAKGDDVWYDKYVLPYLPVLIGGEKANMITGKNKVEMNDLVDLANNVKAKKPRKKNG